MKINCLSPCFGFWIEKRQLDIIGYLYFCEQPLVIGPLLPQVGSTLQMRQRDP